MQDEITARLEVLEQRKKEVLGEIRKEFYRVLKDEGLSDKEKEYYFDKILLGYPSGDFDINMVSKMKGVGGASYVSSITQIIRIKKHLRKLGMLVAPGGNNKSKDVDFAQKNGVRTPKVYQDNAAISDIELRPNTVIKPVSGAASKGVFITQDDLKLKSVVTGHLFDTLGDALAGVKLSTTLFKVEELVRLNGFPAHDLKFYSFYGEPFLALEIKRQGGKRQYCWYDGEGKIIDPELAMPPHKNISYFVGDGVSDEVLEFQKLLSLNSPVPFLRIDFLKGDAGAYLGEITPHPGRYYEGITDYMNHKMGVEFDKAWARLLRDLLRGKSFSSYFEVYGEHKRDL